MSTTAKTSWTFPKFEDVYSALSAKADIKETHSIQLSLFWFPNPATEPETYSSRKLIITSKLSYSDLVETVTKSFNESKFTIVHSWASVSETKISSQTAWLTLLHEIVNEHEFSSPQQTLKLTLYVYPVTYDSANAVVKEPHLELPSSLQARTAFCMAMKELCKKQCIGIQRTILGLRVDQWSVLIMELYQAYESSAKQASIKQDFQKWKENKLNTHDFVITTLQSLFLDDWSPVDSTELITYFVAVLNKLRALVE